MTMVVNVSNQTLKVGPAGKKKELGPSEMADVDMSASDLAKHLFVKSGMLEVSKGKPGPKPKSAPVAEPSGDTEDKGNE